MSENLPFEVSADPFEKKLRGMYGRFATNKSYDLNYMLSSISINQIHLLETATNAFDISTIDFEQLIQRDIDYGRVEKIVEDYLESGENRVIFFPPLLVSLISVENGTIADGYNSVVANLDNESKNFIQTWDENKFQLVLPISNEVTTNPPIIHEGNKHHIYNFGALLKYNPQLVKLVVIDGQHRLTALKKLAESHDGQKKDVVQSIEIPICIVFSPNATGGAGGETITDNLRELFVTINIKGKQVSGHFITLLNDSSLSAMAVRDLADKWKNDEKNGYSRLHLLEWNEREAKRASTRQRKYSISTVSILGDCLKYNLFKEPDETGQILNLMSVSSELADADDAISADDICEDQFRPKQIKILKASINETITPSLDILLRKPRPYVAVENALDEACKWLDTQIEAGKNGASDFRQNVLLQYRESTKYDSESTQTIGVEFNELLKSKMGDNDQNFFLNVFQQGLIRSWITLSISLNKYELGPEIVASALIPSLNLMCFSKEKSLFDSTRSYTQKTLFNGEKIIITKKSKTLWKALILSTFSNSKVCTKFVQELGVEKGLESKIKEDLSHTGGVQVAFYIEEHKKATRTDYEKYWRDKDLSEAKIAELIKYSESSSEKDREKFDEKISHLVEERVEAAAEKLSNVLEVTKELLFTQNN